MATDAKFDWASRCCRPKTEAARAPRPWVTSIWASSPRPSIPTKPSASSNTRLAERSPVPGILQHLGPAATHRAAPDGRRQEGRRSCRVPGTAEICAAAWSAPGVATISKAIYDAVQAAMTGQMSAKDALDQVGHDQGHRGVRGPPPTHFVGDLARPVVRRSGLLPERRSERRVYCGESGTGSGSMNSSLSAQRCCSCCSFRVAARLHHMSFQQVDMFNLDPSSARWSAFPTTRRSWPSPNSGW